MEGNMRVITTGSRWWSAKNAIDDVLDEIYAEQGHLIVVHGACMDRRGDLMGADRWVDEWARRAISHGANVICERWPADWKQFGLAAGPIRNKQMIDAGVWCDTCQVEGMLLAWPLGVSKGTRGCMRLADEAGIRKENYGDRALRSI
jgi:hypothetical protein